jgi:hypothetical protein
MVAGQSRHRCDSNRAPPRRLSSDALSLHPRRPNRECPGRLRTALYPQDRTAREGFWVSCIFLAAKELGGIADPIRTAANIAGERIGEAVALLEQARDVAG